MIIFDDPPAIQPDIFKMLLDLTSGTKQLFCYRAHLTRGLNHSILAKAPDSGKPRIEQGVRESDAIITPRSSSLISMSSMVTLPPIQSSIQWLTEFTAPTSNRTMENI